MKVSLAQINPTLGDFEYNSQQMLIYTQRAANTGSDLVVFPEASLFGYHPVDLLERKSIVKAQLKQLEKFAKKIPKDISVICGAITENEKPGKPFFNSAVLIQKNKVGKVFPKQLLPTYDVFDEARHIEPGQLEKNVFKFKNHKVLVTICEDIWAWELDGEDEKSRYPTNPVKNIKDKGIDLIVNLSASPFTDKKLKQRKFVTGKCVDHLKAPMIYVNMVGAQDELIFDGASFALDKKKNIIAQAKRFKEDLVSFELDNKTKKTGMGQKRIIRENLINDKRRAIVLGIRDYARKTGFTRAHLGLSGGIDSAVIACLAAKALGGENITCIGLPSQFNAKRSLTSAKKLCENLGAKWIEMPIEDVYKAEVDLLEKTFGSMKFSLVHENLQARTRGLLLMAYSNKEPSFLLNTSNKSEMAMGYSTLYGDMCGGLCPIGDLLKTEVFDMAKVINDSNEVIPQFIIDRPPSAELRPNQKDQDSLPEYDELDKAVKKLVLGGKSPKSEVEHRVLNALMKSEFKRWQAPPIIKVSDHAFGRGRRFPVAHKAFF